MHRKLLVTTLVVLILSLVSFTALAGFFPSFGGSNNNTITYTISWKGMFESLSLNMTGQLTPVCRNQGGNEAPGQISALVTQYDSTLPLDTSNSTKTYTFHFPGYTLPDGTLGEMALPSWDAAGCPNSNWSVSRMVGTLNGSIQVVANGRTETFTTQCFYDSSVKGSMACTIQ